MRPYHLLFGLALVFAMCAPAHGASSILMSIANAPRYTMSDVALSPDGKFVAYVRSRVGGAIYESPTLWLVNVSSGEQRQVTKADIGDAFNGAIIRWTADGRGISVFSPVDPFEKGPPNGGVAPRIWTYDARSGHVTSRTIGDVYASDFAWSPDGRRLAVVGVVIKQQAMASIAKLFKSAFTSSATPRPGWPAPQQAQPAIGFSGFGLPSQVATGGEALFLFGSDDKAPKQIAGLRPGIMPGSLEWSPDGSRIAAVALGTVRPRQPLIGSTVTVYDANTRSIIWKSGPSCFAPTFVGVSRQVAYACSIGDMDRGLADVFYGSSDISKTLDLDCLSLGAFPRIQYLKGDVLVAPFSDGPARRLYVATRRTWVPLTGETQDVIQYSTAPSVGLVAYAAGSQSGVALYIADARPESKPRKLSTVPQTGGLVGAYRSEVVHWMSDSGHLLNGIVVLPHTDPKRAPLIVDIHGGPQAQWTLSPDVDADYFASLGYVVFKPNPRGSTGYGSWSFASIVGNWADGPTRDVLAGIDAVERSGFGDARREYLMGDSYGAYLATWMLEHSRRFTAAESGFGVYSLPLHYELSDAPTEIQSFYGADPYAGYPRLVEQSPLTHVADLRTPLLMLAGRVDRRAPYATTLLMFKSLAERGDQVKLIQFSSAGHGVETWGEAYALEQEALWFELFGGAKMTGQTL